MITIVKKISLPILLPGYFPHSVTHRFLPDGKSECIVRMINYHKVDGKLEINGNKCRSQPLQIVGDHEKEQWDSRIIDVDYNLATYNTPWEGVEDIHFADGQHLFVTVPQLKQDGMPKMFTAQLTDKLSRFLALENGKNQPPFKHQQTWFQLTSLTPPSIKEIEQTQPVILTYVGADLKGYEAHSQGCHLQSGEFLFIITLNDREHRILVIDLESESARVSPIFSLIEGSQYEYISSISRSGELFWMGVGIDYKVNLIALSVDMKGW